MKKKPMNHFRCYITCVTSMLLSSYFTNFIAKNVIEIKSNVYFNISKTQQIDVKGNITDAGGMPIAGATIIIEGTNRGTTSDFDGNYDIYANSDDVLVVSFLGYKSVKQPINGQTIINIILRPDSENLKEVVINAGYYKVKRNESTGSISKIKQKDIEKQPLTNPLSAIQGRVAGVEITQTSGVPGAGFEIKIRGQNSIRSNGNDPLYIVDGVPYASSTLGNDQTSSSIIPGFGISPLNFISSSDIESIDILKDADATSIYGSRGANGVVLITTKKGAYGKTKFELNLSTGLGSVAQRMDLLNTSQYLEMRREAFANDGIDPIPDNAYDINGTWDENRETDWQKVLFGKTAYLTNIQGTISGGSERTQFLISGNLNKQTTVFPGDFHNKKISVLSNLNHRSEDERLSLQLSVNYINDDNNLPSTDLVGEALLLAPNAPRLYNDDGTLNWENSTFQNPLRLLEGLYISNGSNLISNLSIDYSILKGLNFITSLGYTESRIKELRTIPSTILDPAYGLGSEISSAIHNTADRTSWIVEPQLHYNLDIGQLKIQTLAGLTFQDQSSTQLTQFANGFTSNNFISNIGAASNLYILGNTNSKYRYTAVFGRVNFNYNSKYILNLTGRRDGSSRFGPDKRFSNFGAAGLAWLFSEEKFIKSALPFLSLGKLRASYGITGNDQIGDYQYLDTYSFGSNIYENVIGINTTRLFNPNYSWEKNNKLEVALDLAFLSDRIMFSGAFYKNKSDNQLIGIPLPSTTGFNQVNANLNASVENKGWEMNLNTVNIKKNNFQWSTSINLTIPKNRLLSFPNLDGSTYSNQLVIGQALNIVKVYELTGVNPQTGLYEFTDFNNDGVISGPEDKQAIKDLNPDYFGGINNSLTYKNFSLDVLFQFTKQQGNNFISSSGIAGSMGNQPVSVLERWQNIGDISNVQRFTTGQNPEAIASYFNYIESDAAVTDASFIRLKTLAITYRLTNLARSDFNCELQLTGQNLITFTHYDGLDPETRSNNTIPPLRYITIGTKLKF